MSFWDRFLEEARAFGESFVEWALLIGAALLVLIIGRWILKWVRRIIERLLNLAPLQPLWDRSGVSRALEGTNQTVAGIAGGIVYGYLMIGLFTIAARILTLSTIEQLLIDLLELVPVVVLAAIIVIISASMASWVADLVRPLAQEKRIPWLATVTYVGIILFGVLFAFDLLNIEFAADLVKILALAFGAAFAIAFGIGGIDSAKLWWAKYGSPKDGAGKPMAPSGSAHQGGDDG